MVSIPNVESYAFNCISAFNLFLILWEDVGKPFQIGKGIEGLPSIKELIPEMTLNFIASKSLNFKDKCGDIHNTSKLLENTYIDLLERKEIRGNK